MLSQATIIVAQLLQEAVIDLQRNALSHRMRTFTKAVLRAEIFE